MQPVPTIPASPARPRLLDRMAAGQFVLTVELVPPRTPDMANVANRLQKYFIGHADAVNVTDCASAIVRMSSLGACLVALQAGIEPVMQTTCRDRNRIALQSDLITAYAAGVRNILCLTGDHTSFGDHPMSKPVYDMDSTNLIATVSMMRSLGQFASGEEIRNSAKGEQVRMEWLIGGAANPYGNRPEHLARHMDKKCRAGCDFIQTQPVYDHAGFEAWWRELEQYDLARRMKIMPGILPPKSARGLEHMKDNVPGVLVPDAVLKRMRDAGEAAKDEGQLMTLETVDFLLQFPIAGLHIYPVYYESYVPELTAEIRARAARAGRKVTFEPQEAAAPAAPAEEGAGAALSNVTGGDTAAIL